MFSLDGMIANGEGYKNVQTDSIFRYGVGATIIPVSGITARVYYDISPNDNALSSITTFLGYKADKFSLGAEYNMQSNVNFKANQEWTGLSFYSTIKASDNVQVFLRYDQLSSNTITGSTNAWNHSKDGQNFIAGVEFAPVKGVKNITQL